MKATALSLTWWFIGPLRIYRVLGSVAFLNSGTTLRPILSKSQCWCVDGESKFVLRVAQNSYYRIEFPNNCEAENQEVEEFKAVLAKLLQYELTPCPFKRGFTVELPEAPKTPVRKRPWKPQTRQQQLMETSRSHEPEVKGYNKRGDLSLRVQEGDRDRSRESISAAMDQYQIPASGENTDGGSVAKEDDEAKDHAIRDPNDLEIVERDTFKTPTRPQALRTGRAITAPPQVPSRSTSSSDETANKPIPIKLGKESSSLSSSVDSFHSFHSPISPYPPSPPYSRPSSPSPTPCDVGLTIRRTRSQNRDSEITVTSEFPGLWDMTNVDPTQHTYASVSPILPGTPSLISDAASQIEEPWAEAITPSPIAELRRRPVPPRRQTPSPLPSPANLYSPRCRLSGHHLTTAILQKTCSLLLGPPVQLVALMLNIAAKIAQGAYRGASFGYSESGQRIPCSWDFSDADDEPDLGVWEEDDYGVSLGKVATAAKPARVSEISGSWEID